MDILIEIVELFINIFSSGKKKTTVQADQHAESAPGKAPVFARTKTVQRVEEPRLENPSAVEIEPRLENPSAVEIEPVLTTESTEPIERTERTEPPEPTTDLASPARDESLPSTLEPREAMKWSLVFSKPRALDPYRLPYRKQIK